MVSPQPMWQYCCFLYNSIPLPAHAPLKFCSFWGETIRAIFIENSFLYTATEFSHPCWTNLFCFIAKTSSPSLPIMSLVANFFSTNFSPTLWRYYAEKKVSHPWECRVLSFTANSFSTSPNGESGARSSRSPALLSHWATARFILLWHMVSKQHGHPHHTAGNQMLVGNRDNSMACGVSRVEFLDFFPISQSHWSSFASILLEIAVACPMLCKIQKWSLMKSIGDLR